MQHNQWHAYNMLSSLLTTVILFSCMFLGICSLDLTLPRVFWEHQVLLHFLSGKKGNGFVDVKNSDILVRCVSYLLQFCLRLPQDRWKAFLCEHHLLGDALPL